jgi:hypothetical protein
MSCFVPFCALNCCAMLLKVRCEAVSQRGGQRFDPAQLHQSLLMSSRSIWRDVGQDLSQISFQSRSSRVMEFTRTAIA